MRTVLLVTARRPLETMYGSGAYMSIMKGLHDLVERWASRSIGAQIVAIDDSAHLASMGLAAWGEVSASWPIDAVRFCASKWDCDTVFLIGDERIVPMVSVGNPVRDRSLDGDVAVLTDLPYGAAGDSAGEYVHAVRAVSRLPAPKSGSLDDFLLRIARVGRHGAATAAGLAIVGEEWRSAGERVAAEMPQGTSLRIAPDYRLDATRQEDLSGRWLYVNLHGVRQHDRWQAYDMSRLKYVPCVTPASFAREEAVGSRMFCETCYGVKTGSGDMHTCIDEGFRAGMRAVVGATGLAYGAHLARGKRGDAFFLENADGLARAFFRSIDGSVGPADALRAARQQFLLGYRGSGPTASSVNAGLTSFALKTLLQFQLLGDPF